MYKSILQFNENSIKSIELAVESSYRISGENATNSEDIVSKQAVKKKKKKLKILYINADEDHVSLQFHENKGDLKRDKVGRKQSTIMPKLIYVFEGIEKESQNSKRNKLINKYIYTLLCDYAGTNGRIQISVGKISKLLNISRTAVRLDKAKEIVKNLNA